MLSITAMNLFDLQHLGPDYEVTLQHRISIVAINHQLHSIWGMCEIALISLYLANYVWLALS